MQKKALVIDPFWDTLGGGERYISSVIKFLLQSDWQVDVYWPKNLSQDIKNRFALDISSSNWLKKIYSPTDSFNYQLLFWLSDGSLPVSFSQKTFIHMQFPFNFKMYSPLTWCKSHFYKFIVNSGFTKKFIDQSYSVNSTVLHPPVDTNSFSPAKKIKQILYIGRFSDLTQKKGHLVLIEVFSRLSQKLPGWKLVLAGGTQVGTSLQALNWLYKRSSSLPIEIITNPSFSQIKKLYSQSEIFWSASGYGCNENNNPLQVEHFGISLVEAMSAGCVPVVSNLGGHKEIVTQGVDGFLFNTLNEMSDYTLQLTQEPNLVLQLSQSAISKSRLFSISNFNQKLHQIIYG